MQFDDTLKRFIAQLEIGLKTKFAQEITPGVLSLSSAEPEFTLFIYTAQHIITRLPNPTKKTYHIDIDQVVSANEKITARLLALLENGQTVYARTTVAARIDKKVSIDFQQDHHLQSAIPGKYRYGLFHKGELVSIAVFSGGRRMRDKPDDYRSFELIRFCHKSKIRVVGGLSKLIRAFIKDFKPGDIMSYVDRDWTHASSLNTIGFTERGRTAPHEFWINEGFRHPVQNELVLAELKKMYPEGYLIQNSGSSKLVLELL